MARTVKQIPAKPKIQKRLRVAAYARVSMDSDALVHSLKNQVEYYTRYINSNPEWECAGIFFDKAKTGRNANRDGFLELIEICRAGNVDVVVVKSISRLARNTVILLETVRELKSLGIDIFFEEQNIHSLSAEGELMMTILASYAQEESFSTRGNILWRKQKQYEKGKIWGKYAYGYRVKNGTLTVVPD